MYFNIIRDKEKLNQGWEYFDTIKKRYFIGLKCLYNYTISTGMQ